MNRTISTAVLVSVFAIVSLIASFSFFDIHKASALSVGLVASYNFNEGSGTTLIDTSGNGNAGTISGATWSASGKNGKALSFNGTSNIVNIPDSALLELSSGMTLEAWVKPTSVTNARTVIMKEYPGDASYDLYANQTAATPGSFVRLYTATSTATKGVSGTAKLSTTAWTHITSTFDGSFIRFYVNGVQVATTTFAGTIASSTNPLRIGGNSIRSEFFSGLIDDVRVYNRALAKSEIVTDMNTAVPSLPDNTAPTVSITAPLDGSPASGTVTLTATSTDNVGVAGVQFYLDGAALGAEDVASPYTFSWDTTAAINGVHTLLARARDAAGNMATSTPISVNVNNVIGQATSIWGPSTVVTATVYNDGTPQELGTKFKSDVSGSITGVRFYKPSIETGTNSGHLWTASGALLGTVNFTSETASGWQQANFTNPIAITAGTAYVVSYSTADGRYYASNLYFASAGIDNSPLHALKDGVSGGNGVYANSTSIFPSMTYQSSNYWADVVFSASSTPDTTAPTVTSVSPANGATGLSVSTIPSATMSEPMNPATINSSTVKLTDNIGNIVSSSISYNAAAASILVTPTGGPLSVSTQYTVTVSGGATSTSVTDNSNNPLQANYSWTFTTGAPVIQQPQGPGGPILVIDSGTNLFSDYFTEILRAEGYNEFLAMDIASVTPAIMSSYDTVIVGSFPVTSDQVTMISNWVNAAGNLILSRPDKQLLPLAGLTDATSTLSDAYLLINTASLPGKGIVGQTMQYHSAADEYRLNGATSIATLYSAASTSTAFPAVTLRTTGLNGGQVATFAYDLPRSIIYTRQGNPAWSGQERDNEQPPLIRPDDMFFPNWVDFAKIQIPQADEQQRLLGNLITTMNLAKKPLPHFWYLPSMRKAVIMATGDDHGTSAGTPTTFDMLNSASPANCQLAEWTCYRATSWVYTSIPLTDAQAKTYYNEGFDLGGHISTDCLDYTPASLAADFNSNISDFKARFPSLPAQDGNRTHCAAWSDWGSTPIVELSHGIRIDASYYYWPPDWINNRMGLFTGSGIPMRYAQEDGSMTDVYQATSQLVNENGVTYPDGINLLLSNALGSQGYYGIFTTHYDYRGDGFESMMLNSAEQYGVALVTAHQVLTWEDGKNASSFGSESWNGSTLSFTVNQAAGAHDAYALLPVASATGGTLQTMSFNGASLAFATSTIKGIAYATFPANSGSYTASYFTDVTPPSVSITAPFDGSTATGTIALAASSTDDVGVSGIQFYLDGSAFGPEDIAAPYTASWDTTSASNTPHTIYARARDAAGNIATSTTITVTVANPVDTTPPSVASTTPTDGSIGFAVNGKILIGMSEAIDASTVNSSTVLLATATGTPVTSTISYNVSTKIITISPISNLQSSTTYAFTLKGSPAIPAIADLAGNALASDYTSSFMTLVPPVIPPVTCPCSIWSATSTPVHPTDSDGSSVEIGLRFKSDVSGFITGIRFYKGGTTNGGTHTGHIWSNTGTLLGSVTFTGETTSGWQQANFATPIAVTAGTVYVASYFAPLSHYAGDNSYFATAGVDNGILHALKDGVSGANGVYIYATKSTFPTATYQSSNYWVDVVFHQ